MKVWQKLLYAPLALLLVLGAAIGFAVIGAYYYVAPSLPAVESLREVRLQVPLRVYTRDGRLLAEFGEKRRKPLPFEAFPDSVVQAFLAAEDDRFFQHPGVDYQGLLRATAVVLLTRERSQGGGTITMQVARNFFLTRERTIERKAREIFLALRIEQELSKQEILTLYLNKIFLGQRAYGVGAAAEVYFGKDVQDLSLAEIATIAGLPKRPSKDNPVASADRARQRRNYVLRRMLETGAIDDEAYEAARAEAVVSRIHGPTVETRAPYVGEMVRQEMLNRYGPQSYTEGYVVTTTLDSRLQAAANRALAFGLTEYDRRHGYRGPVDQVPWPEPPEPAPLPEDLMVLLEGYTAGEGAEIAVVTGVDEAGADVLSPTAGAQRIELAELTWARRFLDDNAQGPEPELPADVLAPGDVVEIAQTPAGAWALTQTPDVQGAVVALDPLDGAVVALTGGFDFRNSKYNRATQARRQPGSSFKPFIYSAALEAGLTPATIINDAPVVFRDQALEDTWRPENYSGRFYGPTRLREALVRSRNLVSIRILQQIGTGFAVNYLERFGFSRRLLPNDLSLALGSVTLTPLQLASAYTTFANGGFETPSYFIQAIRDTSGNVLYEAEPLIACLDCEAERAEARQAAEDQAAMDLRAGVEPAMLPDFIEFDYAPQRISRQNAWIVADMMRDVIQRGTGRRALALNRTDLSGKTGTTNDRRDVWFSGFNGDLVATVWLGFDQERSLGNREAGARTALPMWVAFMADALRSAPVSKLPEPSGLVTARISPDTGLLARPDDDSAVFEVFIAGQVPQRDQADKDPLFPELDDESDDEEPLF